MGVGRYPEIRFRTMKVSAGPAGGLRAFGRLAMEVPEALVTLEVEGGALRDPREKRARAILGPDGDQTAGLGAGGTWSGTVRHDAR